CAPGRSSTTASFPPTWPISPPRTSSARCASHGRTGSSSVSARRSRRRGAIASCRSRCTRAITAGRWRGGCASWGPGRRSPISSPGSGWAGPWPTGEKTMRRETTAVLLAGALLWTAAAASAAPAAAPSDLDKPQLVYLHGRIVGEQQDRRPKHAQFGYYELDQILDAFRQRGFAVTSAMRPKGQALPPPPPH